jgi:ComF family protein
MAALLTGAVSGFVRQAIRFCIPVDCTACSVPLKKDPIPLFCAACWRLIVPMRQPSCGRCHRPFASPVATIYSPTHVCQSCAERPPSYTKAWTLYPYLPPLQDAICQFKYRGKIALASCLAELMINRLSSLPAIDLLMPVPLHPARLRVREFNQSLLLADRIGAHVKRPVSCTNLIRSAPSPPQTTLSRKGRLKNLRGAFRLQEPHLVQGKRILLIDDVFTTGATVNECAKTLRKGGSGDVFVLTLARSVDAQVVPDRILAQYEWPATGFIGG